MSLLERNYPQNTVDRAIERAKRIPRSRAIQKVNKKEIEKSTIVDKNLQIEKKIT